VLAQAVIMDIPVIRMKDNNHRDLNKAKAFLHRSSADKCTPR